jgi:hypothetical protein
MKKRCIILCLLPWAVAAVAGGNHPYRQVSGNRFTERVSLAGVEYRNISLSRQTIDLAGENVLIFAPETKGLAFTTGHSFLVHERPLLRIVHFGFDTTWFDIEYGNWRKKIDGSNKWMHKMDVAIGAGPAIHLSPFGRFEVHAYFHYSPTLSLVTHNFAGDEDGKFELVAGYAGYFSTGLALSWSAFSVGGEYRYGGGIYRGIRIPDVTVSLRDIDELLDIGIKDVLDRQRHTMRGWRVYLAFRF